MSDTVFDQILAKKIPSWVIWQDDDYMAFLTPFPNTPGQAVVIPKKNPGDYLFGLKEKEIAGLSIACNKVARLLEKALSVKRVAMVVEGTGVPYVHAKLYPLHGALGARTDLTAQRVEFYPKYLGYLSTAEGPKMTDEELNKIQSQILEASK